LAGSCSQLRAALGRPRRVANQNTANCAAAATRAQAITYQNNNVAFLADFGKAMIKMQNRCGYNSVTKKLVPCVVKPLLK
jgi:hypothetical protein